MPLGGANASGGGGGRELAEEDGGNIAEELGVPKVMEFYPLRDAESRLELTGVSWQEQGTADVYLSAAILFGVGCGNQGGAAGTMTDSAGPKILSL